MTEIGDGPVCYECGDHLDDHCPICDGCLSPSPDQCDCHWSGEEDS